MLKKEQKNYANELKNSIKEKVYSSFVDNIWVDSLADMQLISKFNKGIF